MYWQNMFLNKILSKQELYTAINTVFGTSPGEVLITASINWETSSIEWETYWERFRILCQTWIVPTAKFPLILEFYLQDETLFPQNDILIIGKLCEVLDCCALVSIEASVNPYLRTLICSTKDFKVVSYDADAYYGERDESELQ